MGKQPPNASPRGRPHLLGRALAVGLPALLLSIPANAQRGGLAIQQNLAELVDHADTIVRGRVVHARVEPHPEFPALQTVVVTLRVQETLKGQAGETFTFRQYIWDLRDRYDAAGYRKAGQVLLFLTHPSQAGLSSPVGLEQGRFRVVRNADKQEWVINGAGNYGVFRRLHPALESRGIRVSAEHQALIAGEQGGPIRLADFRELVRLIAESGPISREKTNRMPEQADAE